MLGNRTVKQVLTALFQRRHYVAPINMCKLYPRFLDGFWRYLTGKGSFPYEIEVRTPVGPTFMRLYSHHDLLTVNEIFCRQDYFANSSPRHAADLGSNIGISAMYFLLEKSFEVHSLRARPEEHCKAKAKSPGFRR